MRRVVITGLGLVSPLGCGYETTWERLTAGHNAARRIETFDVSDLTCQIACQVPRGDGSNGSFNSNDWMEPKEQRKVDEFIIYAMGAATQALTDAGWKPTAYEDQIRTGVLIGSGIGGLQGIEKTSLLLAEKGPRRVSPFFIPGRLINLAAGYVSIEHGLKGPNHAVVTACSTGAHAIGDASRLVALGDADVMLAGGSESPVCRLAIAGFAACRALSTNFNDEPERAARPPALGPPRPPPGGGGGGGRGGLSVQGGGGEARRHRPRRHRLYQCPRHLDADGRRDRAGRGRAAVRQRCGEGLDVFNQVCDRPPPARRRPSISTILRWRPPSTSCRIRHGAGPSIRCCRIPSGLAERMPRWSFAAATPDGRPWRLSREPPFRHISTSSGWHRPCSAF